MAGKNIAGLTVRGSNVKDKHNEWEKVTLSELAPSLIFDGLVQHEMSVRKGILLMGTANVGKTTTLCYLARRNLEVTFKTDHMENGEIILGLDEIIETIEKFDNFKIGHGHQPTTKSIQFCSLPDSDILVVDSYCFDDREPMIVDLSNAIILRNTMQSFVFIYPVFIIDVRNLITDNASSFTKLLKLISRFFSPVANFIQNISFLFSHCPPHITASNLKFYISRLMKVDDIRQNPDMKIITEYIFNYLRKYGSKTILFSADMTNDDCDESRQAVLDLILSTPPFTDFTTLGHPLSSEAQIGIHEKCQEYRISIMLLLERSEYRKVQSEIDILKTLHERIGLPSVTEQYQMAVDGIVSHIKDLIHAADDFMSQIELYENLNENLQKISDARALQDYFDVQTEFNRLLLSLDVIIKDICQVILSTSETTIDSLLEMDQMLAIHQELSNFISSDAKNSYNMLKNEIEERARRCNDNCESVIKNLQSITTINTAAEESSDVMESYLSRSQAMFKSLSHLRILKSFASHLSPQWIACYDDRLDVIISVLEDLRVEVLDENGLMSLIKRQQCDDMTLSRLSFVHGMLKGICSSGMKDHFSNEELASVDIHIVKHVTDIINDFSQNIDTYILHNQFMKIVIPLKIISMLFLHDDNFNSIRNNMVKHIQEIISKKLHIIYNDTIQLQSDLLQRDVVEFSDYSKVVDNTKLLQEASCLDHHLLLWTDMQCTNNNNNDHNSSNHISDWVCTIITSVTSEWQQRLKNMNETIADTILPNTLLSIYFRLDRIALPLENLLTTTSTTTNAVDVRGDINTLIITITTVLIEIIRFDYVIELNPLKLKRFLTNIISWMEFLPSIEKSVSFTSEDRMALLKYVPLLTSKKRDVITSISKLLKDTIHKAHEAFLARDCSIGRRNLDLLQEYITLDEFLVDGPNASVIYEECTSFLRAEISCMNTSANNHVSNGELDKVKEIRSFFENASSSLTSHFLEYDFNSMAKDLLGNKIIEIDKLRNVLKDDGDTYWDPKNRSIYNHCDKLLSDHFHKLDKKASDCEYKKDEDAIDSLFALLQISGDAMSLSTMVTYDPLHVLCHVYESCDTVYERIEKEIKRNIYKFNFRMASKLYDIILKFNRMDVLTNHMKEHLIEENTVYFKERTEDLLKNQILHLKDHLLNLKCLELLMYSDLNNKDSMDFYIRKPNFDEIEYLLENIIAAQSSTSKIRQQCDLQTEDIIIRREIDIIHRFSFSSYDIEKIGNYLNTLRRNSLKSYIQTLSKLTVRFIEGYKKFGISISHHDINSSCNTTSSCSNNTGVVYNSLHVFEFIQCLWEFESHIGCQGDFKLQELCIDCNTRFSYYLSERYASCCEYLKQGDNLEIVIQELSDMITITIQCLITLNRCMTWIENTISQLAGTTTSSTSAASTNMSYWNTVSQNITIRQYMLKTCQEKSTVLHTEALSKFNELKDLESSMETWNLFEEQNMTEIIAKVDRLNKQSRLHRPRQFSLFESDESNYHRPDEILDNIKKQLQESIQTVQTLLLHEDYKTLVVGLYSIQQLEKSTVLQSYCTGVNKEIFAIVQKTNTQLLRDFTAAFQQKDSVELDEIVQDAEVWDTAFQSHQLSHVFERLMDKVKSEFARVMDESIERDKANATTVDDHASNMVNIKAFVDDMSSYDIQQLAHRRIGLYIETLSLEQVDLFKLGTALADLGPLGVLITEEYPQFKSVLIKKFNEVTSVITIDHALQELDIKNPNMFTLEKRNILKETYHRYEITFEMYLRTYLSGYSGESFASLTPQLQQLVRQILQKSRSFTTKFDLSDLLAGVFAVWTILSSKDAFKDTNDRSCLIKPHPVQILGIFCLLGLDTKDGIWNKFSNSLAVLAGIGSIQPTLDGHLIQIGTGEGKSILLGGLSCLLAIFGYEVSCACYSKYLSKRDYEAFKELFKIFEVDGNIKYSTLPDLMESIINRNGNIRELAKQRLFKTSTTISNTSSKKKNSTVKRILLIDEVDVFFSKDFFGASYNPGGSYRSDETVAILTHIFDHRDNSLTLEHIKALPAYTALINKCYDEVTLLLDTEIKSMLRDVKKFNNPPYEVVTVEGVGKMIGYKELDCINTSASYGYKTKFAYLYEAAIHEDIRAIANDHLYIVISCGSFSFADVPISHFQCIMGVTGTLSCLSTAEKAIVENDYKIKKMTISPSIYGNSKLTFKQDGDVILEEDLARYHQTILKEIQDERGKGRPVLIFFESEKELRLFESSEYGQRIVGMNVVTEKTENVAFYVNKATSLRTVTLFPKVFGRGLDFVCRDNAVDDAGGVHVIQTFFSDYTSEEIQIKGRTARQSKKGSYKLILLLDNLTKLGLTVEKIQKANQSHTFYEQLQQRRERYISKQVQELRVKAEDVKHIHNKSMEFIDNLLNPETSLAKISFQRFRLLTSRLQYLKIRILNVLL
eukprot:gene1680-3252_t